MRPYAADFVGIFRRFAAVILRIHPEHAFHRIKKSYYLSLPIKNHQPRTTPCTSPLHQMDGKYIIKTQGKKLKPLPAGWIDLPSGKMADRFHVAESKLPESRLHIFPISCVLMGSSYHMKR